MTAPVAQYLPVERLHRPAPLEFWNDYLQKSRPVILTGIADHWPAYRKWNPEYFAERFGDAEVEVQEVDATHGINKNPLEILKQRQYRRLSISAFVEETFRRESPIKRYLSQWDVFDQLPVLRDDVLALDEYLTSPTRKPGPRPKLVTRLWFGPAGTYSPTHFDYQDNLYVQIWGTKGFVLFSPEDSKNLYYPWHEYGLHAFSPIDITNPDLARFPRFKQAAGYECQVAAGEILFLPARWWHCVSATEPSMSLSHWWDGRRPTLAQRLGLIKNTVIYHARTRLLGKESWRRRDQPASK